jgi:phage gpG-like protein
MDWNAIGKLVDKETEKKTRDFQLNTSSYSSSNLYNDSFARSARASPDRDRDLPFRNDLNKSYSNEFVSEDPTRLSTGASQLPTFSSVKLEPSQNRYPMDPPANRSALFSTPVPPPPSSQRPYYNDEMLDMQKLLIQYAHRLQDVEEKLERTAEGQHTLLRNRQEMTEQMIVHEQEIKTLKSTQYKLMTENENLQVANRKLENSVQSLQDAFQQQRETITSKETIIRFIDSTMEQMKTLNQNMNILSSKNNELSLMMDNMVLSILDLSNNGNSTVNPNSPLPSPAGSHQSNNNFSGAINPAVMNTYQILKSNVGFTDQMKTMLQSSLKQSFQQLFQGQLKPFQENMQNLILMQLKDYKEKQTVSIQTILENKNNYSNEITIMKTDLVHLRNSFEDYKNIHQLLSKTSPNNNNNNNNNASHSNFLTLDDINLMKDKQSLLEKTIVELQQQQKQYHTILSNQNEVITNNTNLQESSRIYYENTLKSFVKEFQDLEKKMETSAKSYQVLKEDVMSENWNNSNKMVKDLSDRNILITTQMNQMKTGKKKYIAISIIFFLTF